jgi:hypothetical protein
VHACGLKVSMLHLNLQKNFHPDLWVRLPGPMFHPF